MLENLAHNGYIVYVTKGEKRNISIQSSLVLIFFLLRERKFTHLENNYWLFHFCLFLSIFFQHFLNY